MRLMSLPGQRSIKIAIVGTGLIGPRLARALLQVPATELICIVDPSPAAEKVARGLQCRLYKSVEEMPYSAPMLDAALVCTPNHTHVTISMAFLKAGMHVLCEKPISIDVASGKELVRCANASGRHLLIGHHRRFNRHVVATKKTLPTLGRIVAISGTWTMYKPSEYFDPLTEWRRLDSAGPILINLIHEIDILHFWIGPILRVFAERTISQRGYAAEEGAAITLRFVNDVVGTFVLCDAVVSPHNFDSGTGENPLIPRKGCDSYRIFGSNGSVSFPDMTRWIYLGKRNWSEELSCESLEVQATKVPFKLQVEHFVKVIRGEEAPSCSGGDGLRAVAVCEAIRKSMKDTLPVNIPLDT